MGSLYDTVPLKSKLTVPRVSILETRLSILKNFEDRVSSRVSRQFNCRMRKSMAEYRNGTELIKTLITYMYYVQSIIRLIRSEKEKSEKRVRSEKEEGKKE